MIDIIEEKPVSLSHVKKILNTNLKQGELNFRAGKTMDYTNNFKLKSVTEVEKRAKAIKALDIPRLKLNHIYKIIDLNPKDAADIKVIIQGTGLALSNDHLKKIFDALNA